MNEVVGAVGLLTLVKDYWKAFFVDFGGCDELKFRCFADALADFHS